MTEYVCADERNEVIFPGDENASLLQQSGRRAKNLRSALRPMLRQVVSQMFATPWFMGESSGEAIDQASSTYGSCQPCGEGNGD